MQPSPQSSLLPGRINQDETVGWLRCPFCTPETLCLFNKEYFCINYKGSVFAYFASQNEKHAKYVIVIIINCQMNCKAMKKTAKQNINGSI